MEAAARALAGLEGAVDADALTAAQLIAASALARRESRGAHNRSDFPDHAGAATRSRLTLDQARARLADLAPDARKRA
jgi:L-aspartate oxidase